MEEFRNYEYEEEIDLKQLLIYVFRKWRTMIVVAVVLGLLLGGVKTAKGFIDLQDPEKVEESIKEAELEQQNYDTAKAQLINQMAEYNRQIDEYQKEQESSLIMKIDPFAVYQESITYIITTDYQILPDMTYQTPNWMGPVLSAYTTVANSITLKDLPPEGRAGLSEEWNANPLERLVKVETNANDGNLTITASAESEARAKAILKVIKEKIEANQKNVAEAAGKHKINMISEKSTVTADPTFVSDRETRLRNITALREAADRAVEKYNKLQKPKDISISKGRVVKDGIKYVIMGGVAGVFICFFIYCMQFLLNGKLNDLNKIRDKYQARILAILPRERKSSPIDCILDGIEGNWGNGQTAEIVLRVTAASLGVSANANIALTGTVPDGTRKQIADILNQTGDTVVCNVGNILTDPMSIRDVKSANSVVLVEAKNASMMSDIEREMDILKGIGAQLEGVIII